MPVTRSDGIWTSRTYRDAVVAVTVGALVMPRDNRRQTLAITVLSTAIARSGAMLIGDSPNAIVIRDETPPALLIRNYIFRRWEVGDIVCEPVTVTCTVGLFAYTIVETLNAPL